MPANPFEALLQHSGVNGGKARRKPAAGGGGGKAAGQQQPTQQQKQPAVAPPPPPPPPPARPASPPPDVWQKVEQGAPPKTLSKGGKGGNKGGSGGGGGGGGVSGGSVFAQLARAEALAERNSAGGAAPECVPARAARAALAHPPAAAHTNTHNGRDAALTPRVSSFVFRASSVFVFLAATPPPASPSARPSGSRCPRRRAAARGWCRSRAHPATLSQRPSPPPCRACAKACRPARRSR
jgi:hypothetical protein